MDAVTEVLEKEPKKSTEKTAKATKGKAAGKEKSGGAAQNRKDKRRKLTDANTVTFMMETEVRKYMMDQAKAAGMDIAPFMQKLAETHVLATAPADSPLALRIAAKRAVLDRVVALAKDVDETGGFDEHFILTVMKKAAADTEFMANYDTAVDAQSANERALARAKAPIHQQMGRLIKRVAGARGKRDEKGRIMRAQVTGEMISAYTLLEKA